jgi:two-component system response regulator AtoC
VAKAIHYNGARKNGPFIAVNCAAIPENLLESELFGYRKGAFTDAKIDKEGLVIGAAGGTLFLDEVTEMPTSLQAKILRVIEEREVRPLGGTTSSHGHPHNLHFQPRHPVADRPGAFQERPVLPAPCHRH